MRIEQQTDPELLRLRAALFTKLRNVMHTVGSAENVHDVDAVRDALFDNCLMWHPSIKASERIGNITYTSFDVTLVDTETGFARTFPWRTEALDKDDKGLGKSCTDGLSSLWRSILLLG